MCTRAEFYQLEIERTRGEEGGRERERERRVLNINPMIDRTYVKTGNSKGIKVRTWEISNKPRRSL